MGMTIRSVESTSTAARCTERLPSRGSGWERKLLFVGSISMDTFCSRYIHPSPGAMALIPPPYRPRTLWRCNTYGHDLKAGGNFVTMGTVFSGRTSWLGPTVLCEHFPHIVDAAVSSGTNSDGGKPASKTFVLARKYGFTAKRLAAARPRN